MKKIFKIIFALLGFLLLLVIIVAVTLGIMLFDNNHNKAKNNISTADAVEVLNYNALETAKTDEKLSYLFDEATLNALLEGISNEINLSPLQIKNIYVTYDNLDDEDTSNDSFTLYVPIQIYFYESCLISTLNVKQDGDNFILEVSKAQIGKINSDFFLVKSILNSALDAKNIQKELAKNGYNVVCEYKNDKFYLTISIDEILTIIEKNISNNPLFNTLLSLMKRNKDTYSSTFEGKEKGFILYLDKLSSAIDNSFELSSDPMNNSILKAESLLTSKIISKKEASYVADYLIRGYSNIEDEAKDIIKDLDLTSIGISNNKLYTGVVDRKDTNIISLIQTSTAGINILSPGVSVNIDDQNINAIIDDREIIGKTFTFIKDNSINYISIGSIYITSFYHKIILSTVVDFNGKEIKIDITLEANDLGSNHSITTVLSSVEAGDVSLNDDEQKNLLEFLDQNLESDLLKINKETKEITFDFSTYFNDASLVEYNLIRSYLKNTVEVLDGYIQVKVKVSL